MWLEEKCSSWILRKSFDMNALEKKHGDQVRMWLEKRKSDQACEEVGIREKRRGAPTMTRTKTRVRKGEGGEAGGGLGEGQCFMRDVADLNRSLGGAGGVGGYELRKETCATSIIVVPT